MSTRSSELVRAFEARDLDPVAFGHGDHVAVAYEMLRKYDFLNALVNYSKSLDAIATRAGAPDKFNTTITVAFMGLIAERMSSSHCTGYEDFISQNEDLLSKDLLAKWYSPERLKSDLSRKTFLLPDAANGT
ncbi:hypothetical protein [Denitrobaculum tricleocarpae]|uniref:Uncharacterized protein n=1 Tax=Denitrobaculum tricleocarpae TaxID=2591009 RepID=A0A545TXT2_9PROT|nr:hypothetical protein [Denitrobaculum tricleocarpae]TQV82036.1 hypothetical protein FKG95_07320 [Denitrobaculum tricleocarpae]